MKSEFHVSLKQFVLSLSQALDLINPAMADCHKRVAYIALRVAESARVTGRTKEDLVVAAALHDIGTLSCHRGDGETSPEFRSRGAHVGYRLLHKFKPFRASARIVRFQNLPWANGENREIGGEAVPMGSHIVHLARFVDANLDRSRPVLQQADDLCERLMEYRGELLVPEYVDAFLKASTSDAFWLDLEDPHLLQLMAKRTPFSSIELDMDGLQDFAELLAQLIDFRSRFTATHSSGVAASAGTLAQLFGLPEGDCKRIQVAGFLHDIGKLAIPAELLEKNGKLTAEEWQVVRAHPYYSYRILSAIRGLEDIALWSGTHHEKLHGTGYPFRAGHDDIPLEARILSVADIFTALTENRPYRRALGREAVLAILETMVDGFEVDRKVVQTLRNHYGDVDSSRAAAQAAATEDYRAFMEGLTVLDLSGARAAHLSWKRRLRDYLDGHGTLARNQLVSHRDCDLGQWYYGEGLQEYGHIPEMRELEEPHTTLHRIIDTLVTHHRNGCQDEAEACFVQVEPLSRQIVDLLQTIEHKASRAISDGILALH